MLNSSHFSPLVKSAQASHTLDRLVRTCLVTAIAAEALADVAVEEVFQWVRLRAGAVRSVDGGHAAVYQRLYVEQLAGLVVQPDLLQLHPFAGYAGLPAHGRGEL